MKIFKLVKVNKKAETIVEEKKQEDEEEEKKRKEEEEARKKRLREKLNVKSTLSESTEDIDAFSNSEEEVLLEENKPIVISNELPRENNEIKIDDFCEEPQIESDERCNNDEDNIEGYSLENSTNEESPEDEAITIESEAVAIEETSGKYEDAPEETETLPVLFNDDSEFNDDNNQEKIGLKKPEFTEKEDDTQNLDVETAENAEINFEEHTEKNVIELPKLADDYEPKVEKSVSGIYENIFNHFDQEEELKETTNSDLDRVNSNSEKQELVRTEKKTSQKKKNYKKNNKSQKAK